MLINIFGTGCPHQAACIPTLFRSAHIDTFVGMMPGLGVTLAGFRGYGAAKRASKTPEELGKDKLEG